MDARELAEACDLHVTTTRFHLDELKEAGLVTVHREERAVRGRPRILYSAVCFAGPGSSHARGYQQLAEVLASHWEDDSSTPVAERARRAGREWARQEVAEVVPSEAPSVAEVAAQINSLFSEVGFDPELQRGDEESRIVMHSCPFLAVARSHPDVVCSMHLGLLEGALSELGAPATVATLQASRDPQLCVAHVSPSTVHDHKEMTDV